MNNIEKLLSDIKELHGKCIITPRSEILLCSIEKDKNKEISMLHNVIWNYAKESEKLKEQFNNIINLIKTADTDEKINMLKELDTLEVEQVKDISKSHFNTMLECNEESDDLLNQVGELTDENTKLKLEVENYKDVLKCSEEEVVIQRNRANKIQDKLHHSQQCSYCICKVCGFDKSKSKGKNKYCSMCLDPAAQQDWIYILEQNCIYDMKNNDDSD